MAKGKLITMRITAPPDAADVSANYARTEGKFTILAHQFFTITPVPSVFDLWSTTRPPLLGGIHSPQAFQLRQAGSIQSFDPQTIPGDRMFIDELKHHVGKLVGWSGRRGTQSVAVG